MGLRIVLLGGPGAGKGTQAARVARRYGVAHISTGEIFRRQIKAGTPVGKEVEACIAAGRLAPDALTCRVVEARLAEADCAAGFVLDGFPRSAAQAQGLEEMLARRGEPLDLAIALAVDAEEIVARLSARWVCPRCGSPYTARSRGAGELPRCARAECGGAHLTQREDDRPETVRERLRVYAQTSASIMAYYESRGALRTVRAQGMNPDQVFATIEKFAAEAGVLARESAAARPAAR